ncbi:hypothetical protein LZ198_02475 [Myxococcus sp. K15C18031901]|uniref:MXAN_2561 family MXYO-CTERM-anchored protein n=1 Tax=Myxococcus dinghuensis TaxID=2906761 RepID=UPI0020A6F8FD|nr:MXAN_2561 family MXYO-CTERM-anchored protein [Myxococcus dinghuensis]MCP3097738.1 hypothetical protein [Myxococcus dinghuensis]
MRLTLAVSLLFASAALGQSVSFSGTAIQSNEIVVSKADCATPKQVTWTRTGNVACDTLFIWLSDENCTGTPGTGDLTLKEISQGDTVSLTGTLTLRMSDALTKGGLTCEGQTTEKTFKLCATTKTVDTLGQCKDTDSNVGTTSVSFIFDPSPPVAPDAPSVTGLDGALSVSVSVPSTATQLRVEVVSLVAGEDGGTPTAGDVVSSKDQATDNTTFRMDNLENGVQYGVRAFAFDKAGNQSPASALSTGTPIPSNGFWDAYIDAGGKETGGCGAGGGGIALGAVLAALGFWVTSRRKQS